MFPEETKKFRSKRHRSLTMPWYPFGAPGNYNCPGQWWAREVIKTLAGLMVKNYRISTPSAKFPCYYQVSLKPMTDVMIHLERRNEA